MSALPNRQQRGSLLRKGSRIDLLYYLCKASCFACIALLAWIVIQVVLVAEPAILNKNYGPGLVFQTNWDANAPSYGLAPFILGSFVSSFIALALALPLGVFIAVFLCEDFIYRPIRQIVRFVVELLAAIPSIVYGLWGLAVIVPFSKSISDWADQPLSPGWAATFGIKHLTDFWLFSSPSATGLSLLTASLVLALMVLPTITAISRNAIEAVPHVMREGAYSLGATRWETILGVILPSAAPGIIASAILGLGRAIGETMAMALLIGGSLRMTYSILSPSNTLAALLATHFLEVDPDTDELQILMFAAVVLMLTTLVVNLIGAWVLRVAQAKVKGLV